MKLLVKFCAAATSGVAALALFSNQDHLLDLKNVALNQKKCFAASIGSMRESKWNYDWDKRSKEPSNCTRTIILIRHGQYNLAGEEDKDRYLTDLGREQAALTGKRLKELNLDKQITRFVMSTMTRAQETGNIIYKELGNPDIPIENTDLIREGAPIEPDPPLETWNPDPKDFFVEGARIETGFREFMHRANSQQEKDSVEVLVCHGNVIRYFVCRALQLAPNAWLRMSVRHGSMTVLTLRPSGRVSLKSLGDTGYMPPEKLSFQ